MHTILPLQRTYVSLVALTLGSLLLLGNYGCSPTAACGDTCSGETGDTDTDSPSGSGGGDGDASGGTSGSGSNTGSGGSDGASGGAVGEDKPQIEFQFYGARSQGPSVGTQLSVRTIGAPTDSTNCTTMEVGACSASTCTGETDEDPNASYANVGHVEATVELYGEVSSAAIDYDGSALSMSATFDPAVYLIGDERLGIEVAGGDLGTFSHELMMPLYVITTNPLLPEQETDSPYINYVGLSRAQGLMLTWERGASWATYHVLTSHPADDDPTAARHSLNCEFPAADGQGFIDPSLLGSLATSADFMILTSVHDDKEWGDYRARVQLATDTVNPAKTKGVQLRLVE